MGTLFLERGNLSQGSLTKVLKRKDLNFSTARLQPQQVPAGTRRAAVKGQLPAPSIGAKQGLQGTPFGEGLSSREHKVTSAGTSCAPAASPLLPRLRDSCHFLGRKQAFKDLTFGEHRKTPQAKQKQWSLPHVLSNA